MLATSRDPTLQSTAPKPHTTSLRVPRHAGDAEEAIDETARLGVCALDETAQLGVFVLAQGYAATLASFGPFSALYFLLYERFKAAHTQHHLIKASAAAGSSGGGGSGDGGSGSGGHGTGSSTQGQNGVELPAAYSLLHGAGAGAVASFMTNGLGAKACMHECVRVIGCLYVCIHVCCALAVWYGCMHARFHSPALVLCNVLMVASSASSSFDCACLDIQGFMV